MCVVSIGILAFSAFYNTSSHEYSLFMQEFKSIADQIETVNHSPS